MDRLHERQEASARGSEVEGTTSVPDIDLPPSNSRCSEASRSYCTHRTLTANVNYSVPVTKMKKLAKQFGSINLAYREVGLKSFDYAYNDLVGDE